MGIENFKNIPSELDIVNIGSGISDHDFDWNCIDSLRGYNLAISPEDFRYDARIIKNYGKYLKRNGFVIIVVCPLSFGKNEYLYEDYFSEKYIGILPKEEIDISAAKYFWFKKIKFLYPLHTFIKKTIAYTKKRVKKLLIRNLNENERQVDKTVRGWIHDSPGLKNLKDPKQAVAFKEIFNEKKKDLKCVVDNCLLLDLRPAILIPPISDELYRKMSMEFLKAFMYNNVKDEVDKGIPLLDYLRDIDLKNDSNYSNGIFLNSESKKVFTKKVVIDVIAAYSR